MRAHWWEIHSSRSKNARRMPLSYLSTEAALRWGASPPKSLRCSPDAIRYATEWILKMFILKLNSCPALSERVTFRLFVFFGLRNLRRGSHGAPNSETPLNMMHHLYALITDRSLAVKWIPSLTSSLIAQVRIAEFNPGDSLQNPKIRNLFVINLL